LYFRGLIIEIIRSSKTNQTQMETQTIPPFGYLNLAGIFSESEFPDLVILIFPKKKKGGFQIKSPIQTIQN